MYSREDFEGTLTKCLKPIFTILTCIIQVNHFHIETSCTEEYRGLTESFVTLCNNN